MAHWQAVLFDLDGVLTDTARSHFEAWRRLADELGIALEEEINDRLRGVDRMASLGIILGRTGTRYSREEKRKLADRKNSYYREIIRDIMPSDLLPGARAALMACRAAGLKTAIASASRNAPGVIENLGIAPLIDFLADAAETTHSKPDPEIFLNAAGGLATPPENCIGVEDAVAGIEAIRAAGMYAVGVGDPKSLAAADDVIPSLEQFDLSKYLGGT